MRMLVFARYAACLGMTNFVLDAGWFGIPEAAINWYGKRGDWNVENTVDFPSGLTHLGEAVTFFVSARRRFQNHEGQIRVLKTVSMRTQG